MAKLYREHVLGEKQSKGPFGSIPSAPPPTTPPRPSTGRRNLIPSLETGEFRALNPFNRKGRSNRAAFVFKISLFPCQVLGSRLNHGEEHN